MIKVTLGEKPKEEKPFPKLMIAGDDSMKDKDIIVLFEKNRCGTVVRTVLESDKNVGYSSASFIMECFTDYNEPITLQNA